MGNIRTPRGLGRATRAAAAAFAATGGVMIGAHAAHAADGGFVPGPRTAVTDPGHMAVGDFNRDSRPDLAVADYSFNRVRILLGGTAGFTPGTDVAVGKGPQVVTVADVNVDGTDDLVVSNMLDDDLTIRTGNGAGEFAPTPGDLALTATPAAVAATDFDADGRPDLVTTVGDGSPGKLYLSRGYANPQGAAVFGAAGTVPGGFASIAVTDLNRDALHDLVLCGSLASPGCKVLLATGASTFTPGVAFTLPGSAPRPHSLATGDFDGDGDPDVAVFTTVGISIRAGNATGTLPAVALIPGTGRGGAVAVADLDHDGRDDLVSADVPGEVRVHLARSGFTFATRTVAQGEGVTDVALADFDGDGAVDIALAGPGSVRLLRGTGGPDRAGNLVVNGDFEDGNTSVNGTFPVVQGWRQRGLVTLVPYGFGSSLFYPTRVEAPRFGSGGEKLLWGGSSRQGNAPSIYQDIDLSRSATAIEGGRATATLSAYLGGARTYLDHAYVTAEFTRTKAGEEVEDALATAKVGPVGPGDRHNITTLLRRQASLAVPRGARFVRVTVQTVDADNSLSSALADNVALTLAIRPEPRAGGNGVGGGPVTGRATFGRRARVTLTLLRGRPVRVRVRNANAFPVTGRLLGAGAPRRFRVAPNRATTLRLRVRPTRPRVLRLRARVTDPSGTTRTVVRRVRLLPATPRR